MKIAGVIAFVLLCASAWAARGAEFDHAYVIYSRVLSAHVRDGRVDYAALKANPKQLDEALAQMAAVKKDEFTQWSQSQQVAFLINLYNASTLRLVAEHYPVKSIKNIGGLFRSPFRLLSVRLFGERKSLDHVEHELLRANYREPRVHFALVCAARSCPPLRSEAYVAARLDNQLDEQGRAFLAKRESNRFDDKMGVLFLSPIFKWFSEDFEEHSGTVVKFAASFFPADTRGRLESLKSLDIRYTDYDWSLNSQHAQ